MRDEWEYIAALDNEIMQYRMDKLRWDTHFSSVLPGYCEKFGETEKAEHLTGQLLFALAEVARHELQESELTVCRTWLHTIILFLYTRCNDCDRTFGNTMKLLKLDPETRRIMFKDARFSYPEEVDGESPKELLKNLEAAILHLVWMAEKTHTE